MHFKAISGAYDNWLGSIPFYSGYPSNVLTSHQTHPALFGRTPNCADPHSFLKESIK